MTPYRSAPIPNEIRGRNPQTATFLQTVGLGITPSSFFFFFFVQFDFTNDFLVVDHAPDASSAEGAASIATVSTLVSNPDEIQLGDNEEGDAAKDASGNPDEIDIGDVDVEGVGAENPDEILVEDDA